MIQLPAEPNYVAVRPDGEVWDRRFQSEAAAWRVVVGGCNSDREWRARKAEMERTEVTARVEFAEGHGCHIIRGEKHIPAMTLPKADALAAGAGRHPQSATRPTRRIARPPTRSPTMDNAAENTLEQTAEQMSAMSAAIMSAMSKLPGHDNIHVIMGSLGSVVGCMAQASGKPEQPIDLMTRTAQGIISGELLD